MTYENFLRGSQLWTGTRTYTSIWKNERVKLTFVDRKPPPFKFQYRLIESG